MIWSPARHETQTMWDMHFASRTENLHLPWPPWHQTVCAASTRVAGRAFWLEPQHSAKKSIPWELRLRVKSDSGFSLALGWDYSSADVSRGRLVEVLFQINGPLRDSATEVIKNVWRKVLVRSFNGNSFNTQHEVCPALNLKPPSTQSPAPTSRPQKPSRKGTPSTTS